MTKFGCIVTSFVNFGVFARFMLLQYNGSSSNPGLPAVECNSGQVVNIHVPLSPSSIIWYQLER